MLHRVFQRGWAIQADGPKRSSQIHCLPRWCYSCRQDRNTPLLNFGAKTLGGLWRIGESQAKAKEPSWLTSDFESVTIKSDKRPSLVSSGCCTRHAVSSVRALQSIQWVGDGKWPPSAKAPKGQPKGNASRSVGRWPRLRKRKVRWPEPCEMGCPQAVRPEWGATLI